MNTRPKLPMPPDVLKTLIDSGEEQCSRSAGSVEAICIVLDVSDAPSGLVQAYRDMADFHLKMKARFRELAINHAAKQRAKQ